MDVESRDQNVEKKIRKDLKKGWTLNNKNHFFNPISF